MFEEVTKKQLEEALDVNPQGEKECQKDEMFNAAKMAATDVKDVVTIIQTIIRTILRSESGFIREKFHKAAMELYKEVLPIALEVSQGNVEGAKKFMFNDKVECIALSFVDDCDYYVVAPTVAGVNFAEHLAFIKKDDLPKVGTIIE